MPEDPAVLQAFDRYFCDFIKSHSSDNVVYRQIARHFGLDAAGQVRRGKRLRPRLLMAVVRGLGGKEQTTFAACTAIELLHNYSLIHDDIEDGDTLRHGRPALWTEFGVAHGINAGDAVGALAQLALAQVADNFDAGAALLMMRELATAHMRMCEGQALDLYFEQGAAASLDAYLEMVKGKTAALFRCAAVLGALCAAADEARVRECDEIGRQFGLAFQVQDDIMGIWGRAAQTGKNSAGDLARRKRTYPLLWALEHDPHGAARVIADLYAQGSAPLSASQVAAIRAALDAAGARAATREAADNYYHAAVQHSQNMPHLAGFIEACFGAEG